MESVILVNIAIGILGIVLHAIKLNSILDDTPDATDNALIGITTFVIPLLYYHSFYWLGVLLRFKRIQVVLLCEEEDGNTILLKIGRTATDRKVFYACFVAIFVAKCI